MKRIITLGLLALTLALPVQAFAASTSGSTPEDLTVDSTISATFPAALTYSVVGANYETPEGLVTIVGSNNATGVTLTAKASVYDGPGAIEVGTDKRKALVSGYSGVGSGSPLSINPAFSSGIPAGTFVDNTTVVTIASSTGPVAGRQVGVNWQVAVAEFTVAGGYSSSIQWTASTNP